MPCPLAGIIFPPSNKHLSILNTPLFDEKPIRSIKEWMLAHNETIAVAESVTSGLVQFAFSTAEDAMKFYQGGITVYNLGQKSRHLHIEPIHALSCDCVSEQVSREMALNVSTLFTSDWGIGITGFASPVPESGNKLFAFYAIVHLGKIHTSGKINAEKNEPFKVQTFFVASLLNGLADQLP